VHGSWLNAEQDRLGASPQQPTWQRDLLKVKMFWHMHGLHETSGENVECKIRSSFLALFPHLENKLKVMRTASTKHRQIIKNFQPL
jgi:hypothetical protein